YDDPDSNWAYTGTWTIFTGTGPYNGSMRYTNTVGNDAQIVISGVRFRLTYLKANNRGLTDVYVDGIKVGQINSYSSTTLWQQVWTSPTLTAGVHTVRFVHAGGGTYIDIDAIEVLNSTDLIPPAAITGMTGVAGSTRGSVTLSWTAVGDDGNTGTAASYLVRYSTSIIDSEAAWTNASVFSGTIPAPSPAGNPDSVTVTGLIPSTTYYFAVRAQDEEGNLGLLSNSPAVVSQSPLPVTAGTYDDTDVNWIYTGAWTAYTGTGPYNGTTHYTNTVGNEAQITINGAKFAFTYLKASSRGLIDVYVDGSKVGQINANSSTLAWQQTWISPTLTAGVHAVRFVHAGGNTYIDIDKIQVFDAASAGTYDDPDSHWIYTGTWTVNTGTGPYNNTSHYSGTVGSEAQFTFNGSSFVLTYLKANNRGLIDVYVDGVKVDQINANNATVAWQQTWTSAVYTAGVHTVRFVHAGGGTYIDIDAIQINS
ncbi:MAG TPA: fibronectin type III domain-containing protein, partial [Anaerolineales bacterium]|nr:fibronectin type III domain-containing protein [Anaerolineales bacterium]